MRTPRWLVYPVGIVLITVILWFATTWHHPEPSKAIVRADSVITHATHHEAEAKVYAKSVNDSVQLIRAKTQVAERVMRALRDSLPPIDSASHDELAAIIRVQDTVIRTQATEIAFRMEQHVADSAVIAAADARADAEHAKVAVLESQHAPRCGAKCGAVLTLGVIALALFAFSVIH